MSDTLKYDTNFTSLTETYTGDMATTDSMVDKTSLSSSHDSDINNATRDKKNVVYMDSILPEKFIHEYFHT